MSCSKQISKLKLLQWNAQGATSQSVIKQIDYFINVENIDIVFIVETFLKDYHNFELTNFVVYRCDRRTHGGGVLIAVRNNIEHKRIPNYNTTLAENISIEVNLDNMKLVLTTAYIPKYTADFKKDIRKLTPGTKFFITFGDFNAKHVSWNCKANNRAGNVLFNMMHTSDFVIHHPGSFTHYPHCGSNPSTIDYLLTNSPVLFSNIYTLDNTLPSDHSPVIATIEGINGTRKTSSKSNFKKADWMKYSNSIEQQLGTTLFTATTKSEIDLQLIKIMNAIRIAESDAVPRETLTTKNVVISNDTVDLIKLRNITKRRRQRCKDQELRKAYSSLVNAQNKCIKHMVTIDYNEKWDNAVRSIQPGDKKVWALANKMMNKNSKTIGMLKVNDKYVTSDDETRKHWQNNLKKIIYLPSTLNMHSIGR